MLYGFRIVWFFNIKRDFNGKQFIAGLPKIPSFPWFCPSKERSILGAHSVGDVDEIYES